MSNKRSKSHLSNSSQNEKQNRISKESPHQKHRKKQHAMDRKVMFLVLFMVVVAVLYFASSSFLLLNTSKPSSTNDVRISGDEHKSVMDHTRTILSFGERLVTHQKQSAVRANDGDDLNKKSGHERTLEYLALQFNPSKWHIEYDTQSHHTVLGKLNFTNLIVTWKNPAQINSSQRKRIILAAHYESKIMNSNEAPPRVFLGATDSVVPCAMMINFAHAYEQSKLYSTSQSAYDVQLVFFDGEEAFIQWSPNDSIYGARQLAQKWDKEDKLNSIHLFLLLDLIGTKDVRFYNYGIHFESHTHQLFSQLSVFENQLRGNSELKTEQKYFFDARVNGLIEDDHIPFYRKKVPVLHLIPSPFPSVWHTFDDDLSALDEHVIEDLQKILVRFLLKYLA